MDIERNETEIREVDGPIQEAKEDKYAAAKAERNKAHVTTAYLTYARSNKAEDDQWRLAWSIEHFARTKVKRVEQEHNFRETAVDAEDVTQEVILDVKSSLPGFRGRTPLEFLSWLQTICRRHRVDFFNDSFDATCKTDGLYKEHEDEDGFVRQTENIKMYPKLRNDQGLDGYIKIPEWITGDDRYICKLIMDGKTHKQIGPYLGMTEAAVKMRVQRMRKTGKEKKSKKS